MSCPTCDHTMHMHYQDKVLTRWYCPRCGTIKNRITKSDGTTEESNQIPELVKRCRQFEPTLPINTYGEVWIQFGIAESINPPATRLACAGS